MLRIGVIGYSPNVVRNHVLPLIIQLENPQRINSLDPERLRVGNTEYIFFIRNPDRYAGMLIDQLIICDDNRWLVYKEQRELIQHAKIMLGRSCVPEDFQIIELELFGDPPTRRSL